MTTDWLEQPIHRLATAIETRAVSVRELVEATLARIGDRDPLTRGLHDRARRERPYRRRP